MQTKKFLVALLVAGMGMCVCGAPEMPPEGGEDMTGWDLPPIVIPDFREVPDGPQAMSLFLDTDLQPLEIPADVDERKGIHQLESEAHEAMGAAMVQSLEPVVRSELVPRAAGTGPQKRVVGWHPYWATTADINAYEYSNLTTIAYFSYEVNPTNGNCVTMYQWNTSPVVERAHSNGVKVVLTATLFGSANNELFLKNTTAQTTLINGLLSAVTNRGGDGVCIDFENVGSWTGATKALTTFMSNLTVRFHSVNPDYEVSIALPSVDWYADFDVAAYDAFGLDYALIMGYDYYYAGSSTPGPVAPLYSSAQWVGANSWCSVDYSTRYYLNKGITPSKLLLAVPYYGRNWRAASTSLGAANSGSSYSSAKVYTVAESEAATYGKRWDVNGSVPYYTYTSGGYAYQTFYDDADSLALKYDYALSKELGGIGIWALNYGSSSGELWDLIEERFISESDDEGDPGDGGEGDQGGEEPDPSSSNAVWVVQSSAHAGMFYGVASREGLHVAVGAGGAIYSSTNGADWLSAANPASGLLMNVNGDGPLWTAVGESGTVLTSADSATWTAQTAPTQTMLRAICYGRDAYIAAGDGGVLMRSVNGVDWALVDSGATASIQGVCYGGSATVNDYDGTFVAVGLTGLTLSSSDGMTWTTKTNVISGNISDVAYGNGYFVAVASESRIARSPDGITWTQIVTNTLPAAGIYLYRVMYQAGVFLAVGANGTVWSSPDGAIWTAEDAKTTEVLRGISYANDQFVAVGTNGIIRTKGTMAGTETGGGDDGGEEGGGGTPTPTGDGQLWATDVTDTSFLLNWAQMDAPDGYEVSVSTNAAVPTQSVASVAFSISNSFTTAEGWGSATWTVGNTAALSTNINGGTWTLFNSEARPTTSGGTPAEMGYIYLNVVNSYIISPPIAGTVTQVITKIRAAGTNVTGRKVTLAYSVNGGTNFTDLATYDASSSSSVLTQTHVFSEGINGGAQGVMFRLRNASTGTGPTVLLHEWDFQGGTAQGGIRGHAQEETGLTADNVYYAFARAAGASEWPEALTVPTGIQPGALVPGVITSNSIAFSWPAEANATGYRLDVTAVAFQSNTVSAPAQTLGFAANSGNGWYYEGRTVSASSGSVGTAPVYYSYDGTSFGHFLVGTNNQALVSDGMAIRGATSARLQFTSGAWNGGNDAETTRVDVYYKTDDGPWNFFGTQVSTSTSDGGPVAFSAELPRGALDGTNLFVKIVAPNARTALDFLRGAYVNSARVTFTSSGGDYGTATRVAGYPRTISSSSAILQDLQPSTFYHFRVQALSGDFVRSRWTAGSATTAAVEGGGGDDPGETTDGLPQTVASQPQGALSGVVVYTSGGHGFGGNADVSVTAWVPERGLAYQVNEDAANVDQLNYFALDAWKAGATVVPFRPVGYQTNEVVLDNVDTTATSRGQVSFSGNWSDTTATEMFYGSVGQVGYRYANINTTGTTATAVYRPQIPVAGEYPVYTWVRFGSDRVPQLYRIHHKGGIMEVRVDHSQVGCGWVWLGNYYFAAGTNGCVEISNYTPNQTDGGKVVIADAIRFGNGMGNVSRGTAGISGYEQEFESSRFWVIKSMGVGMSSTLYNLSGYTDREDNIGQPARMANYMCRAEGGNRWDRLYIGFHSNAGTGNTRGAWGLADGRLLSASPTYYRAQTNLAMQIAKRLYSDMTAAAAQGVIPTWGTAAARIYTNSYGEIYNSSVYNKMDTTINEVAFHDNSADCEVLKTAAGRELLARATTRAAIEHLGNYYSASTIPVVFSPDRPEKLKAVNTGNGGVTLSWAMPARQSDSGAVPTGFVVYTSADGRSFGNPITVADANATSLLISNLTHGATVYFQVCAVNAGGESPGSQVAGAGITTNGTAEVLVVDGFKRCDNGLTPTRYMANSLNGQVALVRPRMINSFDYVKEHGAALAAAGRSFDYADAEHVTSTLLASYPKVVWILGEESTVDETFSSAEQSAVTSYLQGGGRLFVSGAEIGWDLYSQGSTADRFFFTNVLGVAYAADNGNTSNVTGRADGIFNGLSIVFNFTNLLTETYAAQYPDVLASAGAGSQVAMAYGTSASGTSGAAVQVSNETYRVVVMGFPFETILSATQRAEVMTRVMVYFDDEEDDPDPDPTFENNPYLDTNADYEIEFSLWDASATQVSLQWGMVTGALGYIIQTNTDMLTTNWLPAATNYSTNSTPTHLLLPIPSNTPQLFFRIHAK